MIEMNKNVGHWSVEALREIYECSLESDYIIKISFAFCYHYINKQTISSCLWYAFDESRGDMRWAMGPLIVSAILSLWRTSSIVVVALHSGPCSVVCLFFSCSCYCCLRLQLLSACPQPLIMEVNQLMKGRRWCFYWVKAWR